MLKGKRIISPWDQEQNTFAIQHIMEVLASPKWQEMEIKDINIMNEEIRLSLFVNDMIVYVENPKESTKKKHFVDCKFSKIIGYKIIHKNLLYFYILAISTLKRNFKMQYHL